MNTAAYKKCLDLAEQIISSISDEQLVGRYFDFKSKFMEQNQDSFYDSIDTEKAYDYYQTLVDENNTIRAKIEELKATSPIIRDPEDNAHYAKQLRQLATEVVPLQETQSPPVDAIQEMGRLKELVMAKMDSLSFLRNKLKDENEKLKEELKKVRTESKEKLDSQQRKEEEEAGDMETQEKELIQANALLQNKLDKLNQELDVALAKNKTLRQNYSDTVSLVDTMESDSAQMQKQIEFLESEAERYTQLIEEEKIQISIKNKELKSLQVLEKFGLENEEDVPIEEEIMKLKRKEEQLKAENAQLTFELSRIEKKQSLQSSSSTSLTFDEDELAMQIMKSKHE